MRSRITCSATRPRRGMGIFCGLASLPGADPIAAKKFVPAAGSAFKSDVARPRPPPVARLTASRTWRELTKRDGTNKIAMARRADLLTCAAPPSEARMSTRVAGGDRPRFLGDVAYGDRRRSAGFSSDANP